MLVFHCELLQLAFFTAALVRVFSPFYFAEVNFVTSSSYMINSDSSSYLTQWLWLLIFNLDEKTYILQ